MLPEGGSGASITQGAAKVLVLLILSVVPLVLVGTFVTHRSFVSLEAQGLALLHEVSVRVAGRWLRSCARSKHG